MSTSTRQREDVILSQMSTSEKLRLLVRVARDLTDEFPNIDWANFEESDACIKRIGIPVYQLIAKKQAGLTEGEILKTYPELRAEELMEAIAYYRAHRSEIDTRIENGAGQAMNENERLWLKETEKRYKDVLEGKAKVIPVEEVLRAARDRFKR